ncbi:hypothetical protein BT96DRAFT_1001909 [Gymnopus androsaceus JB14]|uniref:Uncharacterized protein n=1 Tax=Gymnopus androsaceus JB14 TaxID=1447944 RepID=A0A6A4GBD6_9AGAR|nr:hypothetical protein BT96DRAFT_1010119 [Gymnopus androsaceus JB14]KAE9390828.1 hypothetical protein BT96DRAFT_1001909 [Gymnopus androsaceus JB14]
MASTHDASAQNAVDMANARNQASIDVSSVKHFKLRIDGKEEWQRKENLIRKRACLIKVQGEKTTLVNGLWAGANKVPTALHVTAFEPYSFSKLRRNS